MLYFLCSLSPHSNILMKCCLSCLIYYLPQILATLLAFLCQSSQTTMKYQPGYLLPQMLY